MLDTIILYTFLTAIVAMIIAAIVKLKKDQVREERDYWIQECAIREREAQFFAEMDERLVPRIMNRFGHNMQDYLIDRHFKQRFEEVYEEQVIEHDDEPKSSFTIGKQDDDEDDPIVGYNLTNYNPVVRQSDILRSRAEAAAKEEQKRIQSSKRSKPTSTSVPAMKQNPVEEKTFFEQHELMKDDFWEDSTVWENDDDLLISEPNQPKIIPFSKATTGRPKIHANSAAKQQAYRERLKQRTAHA